MNERPPTSTVRMQRLYALLDRALEMPPAEREAWLSALAGDDGAHVPRLRRMLAHAGVETDNFMRRPAPQQLDDDWGENLPPDAPGDLIGPWRLIEPLGVGGMATVWLAERDDAAPRRQVALKLPRADATAALAPRMARERDLLAALEHPNIARLYDAGITPQGRPWLAMERVEGEPIDAHVRERGLGVHDIVRLALQVCDALAHAHVRLIVHRDLKPANILVTPEGQVRLVDFGIAKLLQGDDSAVRTHLTHLTRAHGGALTLDYASPEQVRGEPLTTATDVYSLGVVLFELLAGERPYRINRDSAAALEEAILAGDVPLPSTRCHDRRRARALRGDLDAVLARALIRNPAKRYASIESMAADLRAFLEGRPVRARAPHWRYRASKFVLRHRLPLAAGALVVVSLLAGLGGTWTQAQRAQAQARNAQEQARAAEHARSRALEQLLLAQAADEQLQTAILGASGRAFTAPELAAAVERQVHQRYAQQPALRARMLLRLGAMQIDLWGLEAARRLTADARAAALSAGEVRQVARADCLQALLSSVVGRADEARQLLRQARASLVPADPDDAPVITDCHQWGMTVNLMVNDLDAAQADAEAALRRIDETRPGHDRAALGLRAGLADVLGRRGDFAAAIELYERVRNRIVALGLEGSVGDSLLRHNQAFVLLRAGQPLRAAQGFEHVIERERASRQAPDPVALNGHALALTQLGRHAQAHSVARAALDIAQREANPAAVTRSRMLIAIAACSAAPDARDRDCLPALDAAEAALREVPQVRTGFFAPHVLRADHALARGDAAAAAAHARAALAQAQAIDEPGPSLIHARIVDARAALRLGQLEHARAQADRAVADARARSGGLPHADHVGHALAMQAEVMAAQGDAEGAGRARSEALRHLETTLGADAPAAMALRRP